MLQTREYIPTPVHIRLNPRAKRVEMLNYGTTDIVRIQAFPAMTPDSAVDLDLGLSKVRLYPGRMYRAMMHTRIGEHGLVFSLADVAEERPV